VGGGFGPAEGRHGGGTLNAPAAPRPAATVVLMRDGPSGLEVLLLERHRDAGFAAGAYVFPGGVLEPEDVRAAPLLSIERLTADDAARRLALPSGDPPAIAYYVAAVREAYEETAILLGSPDASVGRYRDELLAGRLTFSDLLQRCACRVPAGDIAYFAHWITPERLPRRYDTRFFAARAPHDAEETVDGREIVEARWITPADAIGGYAAGSLPMILPTIRTLERLAAFADCHAALVALADAPVATIMPSSEPGGFAGPAAQARLPGP
jgi:8-oxo-dGTP pyrophosphatase MutT (NUDIX family)